MNPGVSHKNTSGNAEGAAEPHEAACLVRCLGVDRAPKVHRIVGDDADGLALDARQRGDHAGTEAPRELEHRVGVRQRFDDIAYVIDTEAVLRDCRAEQPLIRALPVG